MALLVNALFATALGYLVYFRLLASVGSVATASVGYLKPAVGVLIGCVLLGEPLTWQIAVGLAIILLAVAAINRSGVPSAPVSRQRIGLVEESAAAIR
jgi:drug/metabolite transporter (DMT)-like permease